MSQFGLTRHRRVHTGDFRYKCEECPDAFVSRGQLLAHARNHAGAERPFKCPLCTASFVQRGLLTLHLRKHTGEQPFRCALCAHHFPHRRLLVAHQAVCHKVPHASKADMAVSSAGSGAAEAAEAASGRSAAAAAATSPADGQTGLSDGPLAPRSAPANGILTLPRDLAQSTKVVKN
ncbi:Adult enhancer factor 1 [Gryllus bimaculatus]|nr:Adult enhancer factor 1 [Gryllus bimaculatus]